MRSTDKTSLCQYLYSTYSRFLLSRVTDRPIAIAGLEKRLISSFNARGAFGILDDGHPGMRLRTLAWQRAQDALQKIDFGNSRWIDRPPSWSWMAYQGAIDYLDLPFNQLEWEEDDIHWQWSNSAEKAWSGGFASDYSKCPLTLTVHTRAFDVQKARISNGASIILDDPSRMDELELELKCVVLGRLQPGDQMMESRESRTHYTLLVTPMEQQERDTSPVYNRVGVGFMPGDVMDFSEQGTRGELR